MTKNFKTILLTTAAFATVLISSNTFAASATVNKSGCIGEGCKTNVISSNKTFNNNSIYGIWVNGNTNNKPYEVQVNSSLNANGNTYGIKVLQNGKATFSNVDSKAKTINTDSNKLHGIMVDGSKAELNINNLNITANSNKGHGIVANNGGTINIIGNGSNTLDANSNSAGSKDPCSSNHASGIVASCPGSSVNVKGMEVTLKDNQYFGAVAAWGGSISFEGLSDSQKNNLIVENNGKGTLLDGLPGNVGLYAFDSSTLNIKNMNVSTTTNNLVRADNKSTVNVEGSSLKATDKNAVSIYSSSKANIKNSEVKTTSGTGVYANNSTLDIKGSRIITDSGIAVNAIKGKTTIENSELVATGAGKGLVADNATVTVKGSNVETTSGNAVSISNSSNLDISDTSIKTTSGTGISSNASTLKAKSVSIETASGVGVNLVKGTTTVDNSEIKATGAGKGLVADNAVVTVKIANIDTTSENAVSISNGSTLDISDASIKTTSGTGISSNASTLKAKNVSIETASGVGVNVVKGTTTVDNSEIKATGAGKGLVADNAVVTVKDSTIETNSGNAVLLANSSTLNISGSEIGSKETTLATSNGTNNFNISGSNVLSANNSLLDNKSTGTANINATNSYLAGGMNSGGTINVDLKNSVWNMYNDSSIANLKMDANSVIALSDINNPYKVLSVKTLNGGQGEIVLHTYFGDDNSQTDKIVIQNGGSAIGSTTLDVISTGGTGAKTVDGIKVVDAQGSATTADDAFALKNGPIDVGAYEYNLKKGDAQSKGESWYLKSTGKFTSTAETVVQEPTILTSVAFAGMNNLNKRLGQLRENSACDTSGLWVRGYSKHTRLDDFIDTKMNIYGLEFGYDKKLDANVEGVLYAGVMAGYSFVENIRMYQSNGAIGRGHGDTPSIGAYMTYIKENGWFFDGTFRTFWADFDLISVASNGSSVLYNPNRQISAFEFEAGKQYEFLIGEKSKWLFTPKAEVLYAWADAKSFNTSTGNDIRFGHTQNIVAKATALIGYNKTLESGMIVEPYAQIALLNDFDGKTNIRYDGAGITSKVGGISYEIGGGLNAQLTEATALYSDLMYEKGSHIESFSGNVGVRHTF